jgi:hypothetical protein
MGASQERAAFFDATLLVVTQHRGCIPAGRQADGKFTLPSRFAFHNTKFNINRTLSEQYFDAVLLLCVVSRMSTLVCCELPRAKQLVGS